MKAIIWNDRFVKSQKAFQEVQMLNKFHKFAFITLLEPFQHIRTINKYKNMVQIPLVFYNYYGRFGSLPIMVLILLLSMM